MKIPLPDGYPDVDVDLLPYVSCLMDFVHRLVSPHADIVCEDSLTLELGLKNVQDRRIGECFVGFRTLGPLQKDTNLTDRGLQVYSSLSGKTFDIENPYDGFEGWSFTFQTRDVTVGRRFVEFSVGFGKQKLELTS